jgi:hypothetical protein
MAVSLPPVPSVNNPCTGETSSETYGDHGHHGQAASDYSSADGGSSDIEALGDTGYGRGVPVDPGYTGSNEPIEAHTALLPLPVECPYSAYISEPQALTYLSVTAPSNPDRDSWLIAMKDEDDSLKAHGTWVLTPQPSAVKILKGMWVFTKKVSPSGDVRFKARYVVKGYLQRPGLDFDEVYAPVSSKAGLRVLLSIITHRKMFVRQLDIKTAFLNGVLDPDLNLHCSQPEGFRKLGPDGEPLVCKLIKSLYGLKQAPRDWSILVKAVLTKHGYIMCRAEPAVFFKQGLSGLWSYVVTYDYG